MQYVTVAEFVRLRLRLQQIALGRELPATDLQRARPIHCGGRAVDRGTSTGEAGGVTRLSAARSGSRAGMGRVYNLNMAAS